MQVYTHMYIYIKDMFIHRRNVCERNMISPGGKRCGWWSCSGWWPMTQTARLALRRCG